jgi:hypothetical protein
MAAGARVHPVREQARSATAPRDFHNVHRGAAYGPGLDVILADCAIAAIRWC